MKFLLAVIALSCVIYHIRSAKVSMSCEQGYTVQNATLYAWVNNQGSMSVSFGCCPDGYQLKGFSEVSSFCCPNGHPGISCEMTFPPKCKCESGPLAVSKAPVWNWV